MRNRSCLVMLMAAIFVGCGGGGGGGAPPIPPGFLQVGTAANVIGDRTEIDHALLNDDPSKIVIVTVPNRVKEHHFFDRSVPGNDRRS